MGCNKRLGVEATNSKRLAGRVRREIRGFTLAAPQPMAAVSLGPRSTRPS